MAGGEKLIELGTTPTHLSPGIWLVVLAVLSLLIAFTLSPSLYALTKRVSDINGMSYHGA